jgi:hypothetical protein
MPISLNNSNISVQYNTGCNYIIETVKSDVFVRDTVGTTSNLSGEPTLNPYVIVTDAYYPRVPTTNSATWTDNGYTVTVKVSDTVLTTNYVYFLFNHIINNSDHYHSLQTYTGTGNTYAGATRFKTFAGIAIGVDYGRSIYPKRMRIAPRSGDPNFDPGFPKAFKIFASDDASCWNDNNHSSWTLIHDQTASLTITSLQYTIVNFTANLPKYRYYTMVVLSTIGSYAGGYLHFAEWNIGGDEKNDAVLEGTLHKRLNFIATNSYTLTFPFRTLVDVNSNSNLILQGGYNISVGATTSSVLPAITNTSNIIIPLPNTTTSTVSLRYHLLNPIKTVEGAQWTYSSNNPNVYHLGNVGIGTTSPEYTLDVRGTIYSSIGGYTQSGLTTWSITSDRRIKENIVKASYEKCLENVNKIELYNFNFKDNCVNTNDKHQLGFIAQEVREVYPKAVEVNKMILNTNETIDDILTLNTTQIDYTLYGAVKKLIEKIDNIDIELEHLGSNITYNKDLIRNTSNIFSIITSNISITTSNIFIGTSNISITTSNISIKTSNIFIRPSKIPIETSNIPIETSNIPIETSNIPIESSNIPITSSNIPIGTSNISIGTSNISIGTSNISIH